MSGFKVATSIFKGDRLPGAWSVNNFFTIDKEYDVLIFEGMEFVVGEDGEDYKYNPNAWEEL